MESITDKKGERRIPNPKIVLWIRSKRNAVEFLKCVDLGVNGSEFPARSNAKIWQ